MPSISSSDIRRSIRSLETVGDTPEGFGPIYEFKRDEMEFVELRVFVNAASEYGVVIDGLKAGDEIRVTSASGLAQFSSGDEWQKAAGFVGAVAGAYVGANGGGPVAAIAGASEGADKAHALAEKLFGKPSGGKQRDAYGKNDKYERCEGGVLICLPQSGGTFYSSDGCLDWGNQDRETYGRYDSVLLDTMKGKAFFPVRGAINHNTRKATQDGSVHILAWDRKFSDNKGFYSITLQMAREDVARKYFPYPPSPL